MDNFLEEMEWIQCEEETSVAMVTAVLEDMTSHFLPHCKS